MHIFSRLPHDLDTLHLPGASQNQPNNIQLKSYKPPHIHLSAMDSTPELILCPTCRLRETSPTSYCDPCSLALEIEIENYWRPLINSTKSELTNLHKEQEKFEGAYYTSQYALTEKQLDLELAGRKGETWRTLREQILERVEIYAILKREMEGRRWDLEEELEMHRGGFARELWGFRRSRWGVEEGQVF